MTKLTRQDLWSLEQYAEKRPEFRRHALAHKRQRQVALGDNAMLYFEDETTIRYQVQEMLHIEKVFEAEGIQEELDAYNPLIPDGSNLKATFMLQYTDPGVRAQKTRELVGIEKCLWIRVGDHASVRPIANEDLARDDGEKTSTVHFVRFELTPEMIAALHQGAVLRVGVDHVHYSAETTVEHENRQALIKDLTAVH